MSGMADDGDGSDTESASEDQSETAELPLSIVGDQPVKEGDVIRLTVVSVDQDSGTINVAYDHAKPSSDGGTDAMAEQISNPTPQGA